MVLTLVSLAAREGEQIAVTFEIQSGENRQREIFLIPATLLADLHLTVGEVDTSCYEAVVHGAGVHSAVKRGLAILGWGGASERMLCRKLQMKGISREIAEEAVSELLRRGCLNPLSDASYEAEKCARKLWGRRRICSALLEKGYDRRIVSQAMNSLEDEGVDYIELCVERVRRLGRGVPSDPNERRKLVASLMRYGFENGEIREAFRVLSREDG